MDSSPIPVPLRGSRWPLAVRASRSLAMPPEGVLEKQVRRMPTTEGTSTRRAKLLRSNHNNVSQFVAPADAGRERCTARDNLARQDCVCVQLRCQSLQLAESSAICIHPTSFPLGGLSPARTWSALVRGIRTGTARSAGGGGQAVSNRRRRAFHRDLLTACSAQGPLQRECSRLKPCAPQLPLRAYVERLGAARTLSPWRTGARCMG